MNEESLVERRSSWGFAYKIKPGRVSAPPPRASPAAKRAKLSEGQPPPSLTAIESRLDESLREALEQGAPAPPAPERQPFFQSFFDKHAEAAATERVLEEPAAVAAPAEAAEPEPRAEPAAFPESKRRSQVFFSEEPLPARNDLEQRLAAVRGAALQPPPGPQPLAVPDPEPYSYRRSSLGRELAALAHRQPSFENFVRLFNHFCALEAANFRAQPCAAAPLMGWLLERLLAFLRDGFEARIVEAERGDQLVQARPNMKNVFNRERLQVMRGLSGLFAQALAALDRFERVMGSDAAQLSSGCPNVKFRIFKALSHARKMSRYLSHHPAIAGEIEEARRAALRPRLRGFDEASARLEEATVLFHALVGQLEACERQTQLNAELARARVFDPLWELMECPAIDLCRLFLL